MASATPSFPDRAEIARKAYLRECSAADFHGFARPSPDFDRPAVTVGEAFGELYKEMQSKHEQKHTRHHA